MKKIFVYLFLTFSMLLIPAVSLASFDANLKYGAKGEGVKEMQDFLIDQGLLKSSITGNFFSLTRTAVKLFQKAHNLPSTGYWGPMTRVVANQILDADNQDSNTQEESETGTVTPAPVDRCANISGFQENVPTGWSVNTGICFIPQSPDVCTNIEGVQTVVPAGMTATGNVCIISQVIFPPTPTPTPSPTTSVLAPITPQYTITVNKAGGGTISPDTMVVSNGNNQIFTIIPYDGYKVANLIVDGSNIIASQTYTFINVKLAHTISAIFIPISTPSTVPIACANQADLNLRTIMKNGDLNAVKSLVELCSNYLSSLGNLLPQAAYYNQTSIALYLLDKNFDPNYSSETMAGLGYDPALMYAVQNRNMPLVQALLNKGADVNKKGYGGGIIFAASLGSPNYLPELPRFLISKGAEINTLTNNESVLSIAAGNNQSTDALQLLLDNGFNVNARSNNGSSALLNTVWNGLIENVKLLIAAGADVNAQNNNGDTPLSWASQRGYPEIVTILKQAGAIK